MRLTAVALALTLALSPALAQPPREPTIKEKREQAAADGLKASLAEARAASKVLIVTFSPDAGKARDNAANLAAPATQSWLKRHAVVKDLTEQAVIRQLTENGLKQRAGESPLLFVDDVSEPLLFPKLAAAKPGTVAHEGSIALALRLDWTLRSPVLEGSFMSAHEAAHAPIAHPFAAKPAPEDFVARLNHARSLARTEKWKEAAGEYAALFAVAPSKFDALRLGIVAEEMTLVGSKLPAALDVFMALRREFAGAMDIRDHHQLFEYLILCRIVGDSEHNLKFLDDALSAKSSLVYLPKADLAALEWLLPKCHFNDPTEGVKDPSKWPAQLMARADALEKGKDAKAVGPAIAFARWLAPMEAARRYGWALRKGDQTKADLVMNAIKAWPNADEARAQFEAAAAGMVPAK